MLPYVLAPGLAFLAFILSDPTMVQARLNLQMLETLVSFVEVLVEEEGMGLESVLEGCIEMRRVAREVVNQDRSSNGDTPPAPHGAIKTLVSYLATPGRLMISDRASAGENDASDARCPGTARQYAEPRHGYRALTVGCAL